MHEQGYTFLGSGKEILFRLLNQMNDSHLNITEHDVMFDRHLPDGTVKVILMPYATSQQYGRTHAVYKRVNITTLFYGYRVTTALDDTLTFDRIIEEVEHQYGVTLDPTQFHFEGPPDRHSPMPQPVHVTAKVDSILWEGRLTLWAVPLPLFVGTPNWLYDVLPPHGLQQRKSAYLYAIEHRINRLVNTLTDDLVEIGKIVTFDPLVRRLVAALRKETGDPWVASPVATHFNLYNAQISYAGDVLTINLSTYCNNLTGHLVFIDYPEKRPFSEEELDAQDAFILN